MQSTDMAVQKPSVSQLAVMLIKMQALAGCWCLLKDRAEHAESSMVLRDAASSTVAALIC